MEKQSKQVENATNENVQEMKVNIPKPFSRKTRILIVIFALVIFLVAMFFNLKGEYLKYQEIGETYTQVLDKKVENSLSIFGFSFIILFVMIFIINKLNKKGLSEFFKEENKKMPKLLNKTLAFILALTGSVIAVNMLSGSFAEFVNSAWFGKNDPVFGYDIGVYLFKIPFIQDLLLFIMGTIVALIVYVAAYYVIAFNKYFDGIDVNTLKKSLLVKQVIFAVILFTVCVSVYIILNSQMILTQSMLSIEDDLRTDLIGATKADVTIKVWGYRILAIIIFFVVLRLLKYVKKANFKQCVVSVSVVPVYMVGLFVVMLVFSAFVGGNELEVEREYITYNIENTKDAYGINIDQTSISNYKTITYDEIKSNQELVKNIPVISEDITKQAVKEHQENSTYYSYDNTYIAKYNDSLMYITPREIEKDSKITENNKTYKYTHGYSVVASDVNDENKDGYAEYILSDYSVSDKLKITEPRIYFGLQTQSNIVVNVDDQKEFDYPIKATTFNENVYSGQAGIHYNFLERVIIAFRDSNFKLINPAGYNDNSKIITTRNVIERAKSILPDILYDENPYLVITDAGSLVWVIDGYTRTDAYPYSQKTTIDIKGYKEKINYIRNSVKVLIDAYTGETEFYITDRTDPIVMTYNNMYPGLFKETPIDSDIKEHFVYPEFLYNIQASMINMYHDVSADSLYRADDIWKITQKSAATNSSITGETMKPYYTMVKTKDSISSKLGLVLTYNKIGKHNITSYLVGTVEDGVSKLNLYKFSQETNVVGIVQMNNQIEQDETIKAELEALNVVGTRIIKDMLLIPINDSILYVEPVYQVRLNEKENGIPALKKVIVASGTTVAIGDNLEEALQNLFTDYAVDLEFIDVENVTELVDSLIKANYNLTESLETSDLELIGKDIKKLRTIINQLETARSKEKEKEAENENVNDQSIIDSIFGDDEDKSNTVSKDAFVKKSVGKNNVDNNATNEIVNEVTNKTK